MNAISMNNLWTYLRGLSLTASNRKWLADRLVNGGATAVNKHIQTKVPLGKVTLPTDKFVGMYNFSQAEEDRMREDYMKEKYQLEG